MRRILGVGLVAVFVLAACGKSNGPASGGQSPSKGGGGVAVLTVNTGTASGVGTVLVDAHGLTLYHWKGETTTSLQCTGSCLGTWLPLLLKTSGGPTGGSNVTGQLATFTRTEGTQVTYNGAPLYTYTGDSAPGQANGEGIQGVWFAGTPSTTVSSGASGSGGGGYRYGSSPSASGY
jgi:predicted lipoprotein with Yx(FWY)xxD motif